MIRVYRFCQNGWRARFHTRTEKRELIILIKPTVVNSEKDWADDIARSRDRIKNMSN